jgi:alcohol dehydrogenase YqhD (iron-dependent ADH family)
MNYFMPARLYTGADCIAQHADALRALGTTCLIVTGKAAAKKSGALADVMAALDSQNNRTTIRLSNQRFGVPVSDNTFRWNDPRRTTIR